MKLSDQNLQINCNFRSNKYRALVKSSISCLAQNRLLQIMINKTFGISCFLSQQKMKIRYKINKKYVFKRERCDEFLHTKPVLKTSTWKKTVTKENGL